MEVVKQLGKRWGQDADAEARRRMDARRSGWLHTRARW